MALPPGAGARLIASYLFRGFELLQYHRSSDQLRCLHLHRRDDAIFRLQQLDTDHLSLALGRHWSLRSSSSQTPGDVAHVQMDSGYQDIPRSCLCGTFR